MKTDLVLAVDTSGSIRVERFSYITKFLETLIDRYETGPDKTRVAMVSFSDSARVDLYLSSTYNKATLKRAPYHIPYQGQRTNIAAALRLTFYMFPLQINCVCIHRSPSKRQFIKLPYSFCLQAHKRRSVVFSSGGSQGRCMQGGSHVNWRLSNCGGFSYRAWGCQSTASWSLHHCHCPGWLEWHARNQNYSQLTPRAIYHHVWKYEYSSRQQNTVGKGY